MPSTVDPCNELPVHVYFCSRLQTKHRVLHGSMAIPQEPVCSHITVTVAAEINVGIVDMMPDTYIEGDQTEAISVSVSGSKRSNRLGGEEQSR